MSDRTVKGIVSKVDAKDFPNRNGPGVVTLHSFQLEGANQWFRAGERPLDVARGQYVEFVADGQKVDRSSLRVVQSVVAPAPSVKPGATAQTYAQQQTSVPTAGATDSTVMSTPVAKQVVANDYTGHKYDDKELYWANKEARDLVKEARYQSVSEPRMALSVAVEAASRIIPVALTSEALGFGTAAKSKRLGLLNQYVKETALDLAVFIQNAPEELAKYRASLEGIVDVEPEKESNE